MTTTVTTRYAAGATSWAFAPDPAVALRYTIEASTAQGTQTRSIDVLGAVPPLSFTLP